MAKTTSKSSLYKAQSKYDVLAMLVRHIGTTQLIKDPRAIRKMLAEVCNDEALWNRLELLAEVTKDLVKLGYEPYD